MEYLDMMCLRLLHAMSYARCHGWVLNGYVVAAAVYVRVALCEGWES